MNAKIKKAIYPGSFDPITFGHLDIIQRSTQLFDEIIVGVLNNQAKHPLFSVQERVDMISELVAGIPGVRVLSFEGLLVDFARQMDATIIIRGLRAVTDFEYEIQIAQTNHVEYEALETVFLTTSLRYSYLSSTIVREIASYHGDITSFVPREIIPLIEQKMMKTA